MDAFYHAASQLPGAVSQALMRIPPRWAGDITEIRLRSGRPVSLSTPSGARFVSIDGGWREKPDTGVLSTPHALVQNCFQAICGYSVHSFADCIANGFVPLPGGHRAGVCGTAFVDGSGTFTLKNITSINLRVARTGLCACDAVLRPLLCAPGVGLLIAGAPGSGKTTLLRAVLAELSAAGRKTAVVDERFEIAPWSSPASARGCLSTATCFRDTPNTSVGSMRCAHLHRTLSCVTRLEQWKISRRSRRRQTQASGLW